MSLQPSTPISAGLEHYLNRLQSLAASISTPKEDIDRCTECDSTELVHLEEITSTHRSHAGTEALKRSRRESNTVAISCEHCETLLYIEPWLLHQDNSYGPKNYFTIPATLPEIQEPVRQELLQYKELNRRNRGEPTPCCESSTVVYTIYQFMFIDEDTGAVVGEGDVALRTLSRCDACNGILEEREQAILNGYF